MLRILTLLLLIVSHSGQGRAVSPITTTEFVFEAAPFASAHASTIVETRDGLVVAWFGGTREGAPDVGIWLSRRVKGAWERPIEVANGIQSDGTRFPCWNPVLFEMPGRRLTLFYKVGPNPRAWRGMVRTSADGGRTWSETRRLPDGILGPIKNKPVRLPDGAVVSPSSTESPEVPGAWRVHFERTVDAGRTWTTSSPAPVKDWPEADAIQPSILVHPGGVLQAVGRTRSGRVFETWSRDAGRTWSPIELTALPNPNSGIDAVTLADGVTSSSTTTPPRGARRSTSPSPVTAARGTPRSCSKANRASIRTPPSFRHRMASCTSRTRGGASASSTSRSIRRD